MAEYNVTGNIIINYTIPKNDENIVSGESLNVIIGKIAKRLDNTNNCYIIDNDGESDTYDIKVNASYSESENIWTISTSTMTFSAQPGSLYTHDAKSFGNNSFSANNSIAKGTNSVAFGDNNYSLGETSSTFGQENVIDELSSVSFVEGYSNMIINGSDYGHAEGQGNICYSSDNSHIEGYGNSISQSNSTHAEGQGNRISNAPYSHVEGSLNKLNAQCTHAEGQGNTCAVDYSHSEGMSNTSAGYASHSEGTLNLSQGFASHSENSNNKSVGESSHAGGTDTMAIGARSFTHGKNLVALAEEEFVVGRYNYPNNDQLALFTIGCGTDEENLENLLRIKSGGNVECGTDLTSNTAKKIYNLFKPAGERMDTGTTENSSGSVVVIPDKDQGNSVISGTASLIVGQSNVIENPTGSLIVGANNNSEGTNNYSLLVGSNLLNSGNSFIYSLGTTNTTSNDVYATIVCGANNYIEKSNYCAVFGVNNIINKTPDDSTGNRQSTSDDLVFGKNNTITVYSDNFLLGGQDNTLSLSHSGILIGYNCNMSDCGYGSVLFGYENTVSSSIQSFCTGLNNNITNSAQSTVFGSNNIVNDSSTSFVYGSENMIANGHHNSIEGSNNTIGDANHVPNNTHVCGYHCISHSNNQFVIGKYNTIDDKSTYAFIIGNGKTPSDINNSGETYTEEECENLRSTALQVDWDGTVYIAGKYKHINSANILDISNDDVHLLEAGETYYIGELNKTVSLSVDNTDKNGYDNIILKFYVVNDTNNISFVTYDDSNNQWITDSSIIWNYIFEANKYYSISLEYDILINKWIPFIRCTDYS